MFIVVKVGGDLLVNGLPQGLIDELEVLNKEHRVILVHGGGDIVTGISNKLGCEPRFVISPRGFKSRYTDRDTAEIYAMVMSGKINKEIVSALQRQGISAVGLSGLDGGLIRAKRKKRIIVLDERGRKMLIDGGFTGRVEGVNCGLLSLLLENGYMPVVSPVAAGEESEPLNVDGDRTAASVASALKADVLILLTDVEGIRLGGNSITELHISDAKRILDKMGEGMITKLYAAVEAVERGVDKVVIASGLGEAALSSALEGRSGTVIYG